MTTFDQLMLADGDQVVAVGRVVSQDGTTWLDPPLPVTAIGGDRPVSRATGLAVGVIGADVAQLPDPRKGDGVVEAYAQVTGTWRQGQLLCQAIGPLPPAADAAPRWNTPPCPEPAGGWPSAGPTGNLPVPPDTIPPDVDIVSRAVFRPTPQTVVAVISATDTAAAERALRPLLGPALCVVEARWSRDQVDKARDRLNAAIDGLGAYQTGETVSELGQPLLTMGVVRVTDQLLHLLDEVPTDLLDLDVWLQPSTTAVST